jgi:hypothetical protein
MSRVASIFMWIVLALSAFAVTRPSQVLPTLPTRSAASGGSPSELDVLLNPALQRKSSELRAAFPSDESHEVSPCDDDPTCGGVSGDRTGIRGGGVELHPSNVTGIGRPCDPGVDCAAAAVPTAGKPCEPEPCGRQ